MKRTVWLAGALVVLVALAVTAVVEAGDKSDKAKLKGVWEVTSMKVGGKNIELPPGTKMVLTIDGEKVSFDDGKKKKEGTLKLDETKKPKEYQILEGAEVKLKGIYQLEGDTLKMAGSDPKGPTPSGFDDAKAFTLLLKRAKK